MNKAFISLYSLIVLSVIIIGIGLDRIWTSWLEVEENNLSENDIIRLIENQLATTPLDKYQTAVDSINSNFDWNIELLHLDDFSSTPLLQRLIDGETILLEDKNTPLRLQKKIQGQPYVINFTSTITSPDDSFLHTALLIVFYLALAIVVFFWVWPLSRDLNRLEAHTEKLAAGQLDQFVSINPGSTVYALAKAFNHMSERIRDLLRSHREMTHAISHELRTPLARMKFALEIASKTSDQSNSQAQIHGLREDVKEMNSLIDSLLNYATLEEADSKLSFKTGDMPYLINSLISRCTQNQNEPVDIEFHNHTNNGMVSCDWLLMERAIINLLQNAMRFANTKVIILLESDDSSHSISVADDGPGIPDDQRERVLESFVRLNSKPNTVGSGFGLGLAIVNRIMQWHNGRIVVSTSDYGGALFTISWPKQPQDQ